MKHRKTFSVCSSDKYDQVFDILSCNFDVHITSFSETTPPTEMLIVMSDCFIFSKITLIIEYQSLSVENGLRGLQFSSKKGVTLI